MTVGRLPPHVLLSNQHTNALRESGREILYDDMHFLAELLQRRSLGTLTPW